MQIERTKWNKLKYSQITPKVLVHKFCAQCVGSQRSIGKCRGNKLHDGPCPLFPYRFGKKGKVPIKPIRRHCLLCMGNSARRVKDCSSKGCCLRPYRFGKRLLKQIFTKIKRSNHGEERLLKRK